MWYSFCFLIHDVKFSRFNIICHGENGKVIICNTLTGAVAVTSKQELNIAREILHGSYDNTDTTVNQYVRDLKRGGFVVEDSLDEAQRARYLHEQSSYRTDTLDLTILPTEQCNFRCVYCYENFRKGEMNSDIIARTKSLVEKRARFLNRLRVSWFGGEPLLAANVIEELSETFTAICDKQEVAYSSGITTNGYLLNEDMFLKLLRFHTTYFQVTIDGSSEYHDKRRKLVDGSHTFDVILQNLKTASKVNGDFEFVIRSNFDRDNVHSIPQLLAILKEILQDDTRFSIFFKPISEFGGESIKDSHQTLFSGKEAQNLLPKLYSEASSMGFKTKATTSLRFDGSVCYAAFANSFVIGSDGTLYKCTLDFENQINKVGYLNEQGDMKLETNKMFSWVSLSEDNACRNCFLLPTCQANSCPLHRIRDKERPCPTNKHVAKRMLSTIQTV